MEDRNATDLGEHATTIALDFDGVIASYTQGWQGPVPVESPIPGALEAISAYQDAGLQVVVFSARASTPEGVAGILDYLVAMLGSARVDRIVVTATKPPARLYLDDRAVPFRGRFPTVEDVLAFAPWKPGDEADVDATGLVAWAATVEE